jgi:hypothetical protein
MFNSSYYRSVVERSLCLMPSTKKVYCEQYTVLHWQSLIHLHTFHASASLNCIIFSCAWFNLYCLVYHGPRTNRVISYGVHTHIHIQVYRFLQVHMTELPKDVLLRTFLLQSDTWLIIHGATTLNSPTARWSFPIRYFAVPSKTDV